MLPEKAKTKNLTAKQSAFLELLFSEECNGDINLAYKKAGYTSNHPDYVLEAIAPFIVDRANAIIAANAVKAATGMLDVLDKPETLGAAVKLNAAKELLDRAGVNKKADAVAAAPQIGIFILPEKKELPQYVTIEHNN